MARHPRTRVVWAGGPADRRSDGRRLEELRAELGVPTEPLVLHDAWLPDGVHWSETGVRQAAEQLCP